MVEYLEREFGERALNGDKNERAKVKAQIADLEAQLAKKQAADDAKAKDSPKSDVGSEHETDSDVGNAHSLPSFVKLIISQISNFYCFRTKTIMWIPCLCPHPRKA